MTFQRLTIGQHDFIAVSVYLVGGLPLLGNGWHRVLVAHNLALYLGGFACLKVGLRLCHCLIVCNAFLFGSHFGCTLSLRFLARLVHSCNLLPMSKTTFSSSLFLTRCRLVSLKLLHAASVLNLAHTLFGGFNLFCQLCHHTIYILTRILGIIQIFHSAIPSRLGVCLLKHRIAFLIFRNTRQRRLLLLCFVCCFFRNLCMSSRNVFCHILVCRNHIRIRGVVILWRFCFCSRSINGLYIFLL